MQKTGCTHIASLLSKVFDGKLVSKHNAASSEQIDSNYYFISSIRNPWDWYLSLWTFGVQGGGGLANRLTNKTKDTSLWREVYEDSSNVELFRKWLRLIHTPDNSSYLNKDYGDTAVTEFCGFMSYRYLRLCCSEASKLDNHRLIASSADLVKFEKKTCYIDFFIRQECLEDDFLRAIERIKPLNKVEKDKIFNAEKVNISTRPHTLSRYYDKESIELIYNRDRLLIDKFGYTPPLIAAQKIPLAGHSTIVSA